MARKILAIELRVPSGVARFADRYGARLAKFREGGRDNNNLRVTPERNLEMHIMGARGEAALYWYLGGWWGGAVWDHSISNARAFGNTPDIAHRGCLYDAKAVPLNKLSLVVYPKGAKAHWRYVLVGVQFWPESVLIGWCLGSDVLATSTKEKVKGRPAYFIEQGSLILRSCAELFSVADEQSRIDKFQKEVG
jgi:hypothetical protein